MTNEELLLPRIQVTNIYPFNNHFLLGEIIVLTEFDDRNHLSAELQEAYVVMPGLSPQDSPCTFYESTFKTYPYLFRKIDWHEYRSPEEMPEYISYISVTLTYDIYTSQPNDDNLYKARRFVKATNWRLDEKGKWFYNHHHFNDIKYGFYLPATKEEYDLQEARNKVKQEPNY